MEEKDFTIWHPYVSDDGTYEPKAYSFRERVATLSDPCDLMEFLKASYLTEGFCLKKCEKWNGDFVKNVLEMIDEDYVSFMDGFRRGQEETVERAYTWLKTHTFRFDTYDEVDMFLDLFRKEFELKK